ncbi:MAG TPA: uroporphyrinogen-III C-methyltransferase, partial [Actinomycetota bacterium]|nr:uroporphyrinogen-III C-methyltransferase [Actinomycetota bacterium]
MAFAYPIALELEGRACVVIGGGEVAEQKVFGLLAAAARVTVIAPEFTAALETAAERGEIELRHRAYEHGDLDGFFLAIAATDEPATNRRIFEEANERGVLLNAVDDVANCHFALPSVVRRGDFVVAISTGGKAPALAKRLRRELSDQFGDEYGELVEILGAARMEALPHRTVDFATWANRWQIALDQQLLDLVRRGRSAEAQAVVRRILDGDDVPPKPRFRDRTRSASSPLSSRGRVAIVGAGPGDPGLITLRGKELLDAADVVVYDRLVHPSLVAGKPGVFVGKRRGGRQASQEQINAVLVDLARRGNVVVRLKGGDPFVFGRGSEEAEALADAGIAFEVVPAPTSAIAALAYAGIPVTDRRYSSSVAFIAGQS